MGNFNDFTAHGYEVIRELGANRGAGRIAYLAREIDSEQLVVIKQFQFAQGSGWDGHKEIDREVKILQQLKHPNIPRYLASFETPQSSCLVQEYIDGKPLSEIISNQQLYTPEQVKEIILKLLEVLVYLQKTFTDPVLHRDIKPANILIDSSCQPYLIDFGGAKVSEGAGGSTVSIGTLGFMPREQRFQQFNKTTDIYSLGMSIVCWLTRTEPTEMFNIINMGTNQVIGLRELLSAYSLRFVDWLEKVVQPDPKDRYPDAEAAFNAFKPLYVKRVPEAIVSRSVLEFTASKLGERITQTLTVRNNVPETVLEGWWEVAPHSSDPPHTPNSHAWISFGSRKFSGNANECSIVVNTDKLMAGKVYKRKIFLNSNSSKYLEELVLNIKTAEVPIKVTTLTGNELIILLVLGLISSSILIPTIIINWIGCYILFGNNVILANFALTSFIGFFAIVVRFGFFQKQNNNSIHKTKLNPLKRIVFLLITLSEILLFGTYISFLHYRWSMIYFIWVLILTLVILILTLIHPTIKHKKLVSKYRDSEKGLIRP
jgi:serine/threonine protein kinase